MWRGESYNTFPTPFRVLLNNSILINFLFFKTLTKPRELYCFF
jgi:hypothetical protein